MPVRVYKGRRKTIGADRAVTQELLTTAAERRQPAVRVWAPHRQVAFGRRDAREPGYDTAKDAAKRHGYPAIERQVGGRAVAYTGTTLAFAYAEPISDARSGMDERYETVTTAIETALSTVGVDATRGEPENSFCPGTHSLSADGKLVGLAQRVKRSVALTAGIAVPDRREEIATVLDPVYDALGVPFAPTSVGSVEAAGGEPDTLDTAIEAALVDGRQREIVRL